MYSKLLLYGFVFCLYSLQLSSQQEALAFENCDVISCPVDCNVTFVDGEECPLCSCPMGQRCPFLNCPPAPTCIMVQRLDGCLSCSCSLATYEVFNEVQNLHTFSTTFSDVPGGVETCNLYDTQSVQRCMKNMFNFMKLVELKNANVILEPLYSMFLYRQEQIGELCDHYSQAVRCMSTDTLSRCRNKERHLHMMTAMFAPICGAMSEQYIKQYECIHNILSSHHQAEACAVVLSRTIEKAIVGPYPMAVKREKKCQSMNSFISCVDPILRLYCGRNSSDIFKSSILDAGASVAPECVKKSDRFEPLIVVDVTLPPTLRTLLPTFDANSSLLIGSLRDSLLPAHQKLTGDLLRKRCDFIPVRDLCPNETKPQAVSRWYRKSGENECQTYQYMYCGIELESVDRPIKFREECNELCFSDDEKLLGKKSRIAS